MKQFLIIISTMMGLIMSEASNAQDIELNLDKDNTLYMDLEFGRVIIAMRPDIAPKHVTRIKELAREGFYDGLTFHRVIEGFMAQGGDPLGTGTGGSGVNIPAEFNDVPHLRGTTSMARANDPDSADSQFFICFTRCNALDNSYTVWGRVVSGMEFVDMIQRGEPPRNPTKMLKVQVAADVDK